jgi:outer membrane protein assembly factor BamB
LVWIGFGLTSQAEGPWPSWRGPTGNGVAAEGTFPVSWGEGRNIKWKIPLDGRGASTPIEFAGNMILTLGSQDENIVMAVDSKGNVAWQQRLGKERPAKHAKASGANSSPVSDGERCFVYFKSGDLAALNAAGQVQWKMNIQTAYGEDSLWWDLGTSPIVTDNAVVVTVMQTGPSFLVALDKMTGKELWRADRWLDRPEEANQSYTTPTRMQIDGEDAIVTLGADYVTAHRASNGELLWKMGGLNPGNDAYFRSIASPVASGKLVLCPYARGSSFTAVLVDPRLDASQRVAWRLDFGADVPTPAVHHGRVYLLSDKGMVTCLAPETGTIHWKESLPKSNKAYSSSPLIAGGKLYCTREDATTFVLDGIEGDHPQLASKNDLEGFAVASPVAIHGQLFLRTFEALYCIASDQ